MLNSQTKPRPVRVGLVGAGFAANLHAEGYKRLADLDLEIVGVAASSQASAERFAARHGIPHAYDNAAALMARDDVNLIDLCVPNDLHEPLAVAAAQAGKHIICEKPLTGYFGGPQAATPVGRTSKVVMFDQAVASAERMLHAAETHGVSLAYAENWLYAPTIARAVRLAQASGGTILEIRAQECHSGSHAAYAKSWSRAGGGALLRLGSHPIGAALWLKWQEGLWRGGAPIRVTAVTAEVGDLSRMPAFQAEAEHFLVDDWQDVENWSATLITFADGSRAVIAASDVVLGGMDDTFQLLLSNCRIDCDLCHHGAVKAFAPHDAIFGDEYIMEKLSTKAGWSYPSFDEDYMLGYPQEMRDLAESVAYDRPARSSGALGLEVVRVIYAAYRAAEEGRRIELA
ncbi:MAG: Gfo/Idh/MocA family oxidoreductase [Anaerolineae bacterium]|nr:Gfo/Idh/MocA family oxidoreductase [Anaerolineae bacterium]